MKLIKHPVILIHILLLIFSVLILYLPTLNFNFVLDDHQGVEQNKVIRELETVVSNPVAMLKFLPWHISYQLGQLDPSYYRILNILLHLGTVLCIYTLIVLVSSPPRALFTALLFAVHPVLVESIVWVSAFSYLEYSFFFLCSFIFYILQKKATRKLWYSILFFVFFVLALLSLERALVLLLAILLYEWLFGSIRKNWKLIVTGTILIVGAMVIFFPAITTRINAFSANNATGTTEFINPLLQFPVVLGTYINLIFWPQRLTLYHLDEAGIPYPILAFYSVLFTMYLVSLFLSYKKDKKIFFFLSFFFIATIPALIPIHIIQIAAERYAYLGAFGLIAAVVLTLFNLIAKYKVNAIWLYLILSTCVMALAWRTTVRARDWESEMSLRLATLNTAPYSARAHNNVGIQLMNEGNDEDALVEYKKAIVLKPDYSHPYHNIGHMLALRA